MLLLADHYQADIYKSNAARTKCLWLPYCSFVQIVYTEMDDDNHKKKKHGSHQIWVTGAWSLCFWILWISLLVWIILGLPLFRRPVNTPAEDLIVWDMPPNCCSIATQPNAAPTKCLGLLYLYCSCMKILYTEMNDDDHNKKKHDSHQIWVAGAWLQCFWTPWISLLVRIFWAPLFPEGPSTHPMKIWLFGTCRPPNSVELPPDCH